MADATPEALAPAVNDPAASAAIRDADEKLEDQEMITEKYGGRMMTLTKVSSKIFGMMVCIPFTFLVVGEALSNPNGFNDSEVRVVCMMGVGLVVAVSLLPLHCAERVQREQRIKGFYGCFCGLVTVHLLLLLFYGILLSIFYTEHFTWHGCGPSQCVPPSEKPRSEALLEALERPGMEEKMLDCFAKGRWPDYELNWHDNQVYPARCRKVSNNRLPMLFIKLPEDYIHKKRKTAPTGPPRKITWENTVEKLGLDEFQVKNFDFSENNTWQFGLLLFLMSFHCALLAMSCFAVQAGHKVHQAQVKEVEIEMALVGKSVSLVGNSVSTP